MVDDQNKDVITSNSKWGDGKPVYFEAFHKCEPETHRRDVNQLVAWMILLTLIVGAILCVVGTKRAHAQTATDTIVAVTVSSTSAKALSAGRRTYLRVWNQNVAADPVTCAFGATAVANSAGQFTIPGLSGLEWHANASEGSNAFTPLISQELDCISAAGVALTIEYH